MVLFACTPGGKKTVNEQSDSTVTVLTTDSARVKAPVINVDSLIGVIDAENARIESTLKSMIKTSLKTREMREQIKQKWSLIEFYSENSQVVKIVTLPHPQISKRTEEFTFRNGKLILAIIGDHGMKEDGKPGNIIDKAYYFLDDKCIKEDNRSKETETTIRNSDSERLVQEAGEYLSLFPKK